MYYEKWIKIVGEKWFTLKIIFLRKSWQRKKQCVNIHAKKWFRLKIRVKTEKLLRHFKYICYGNGKIRYMQLKENSMLEVNEIIIVSYLVVNRKQPQEVVTPRNRCVEMIHSPSVITLYYLCRALVTILQNIHFALHYFILVYYYKDPQGDPVMGREDSKKQRHFFAPILQNKQVTHQ